MVVILIIGISDLVIRVTPFKSRLENFLQHRDKIYGGQLTKHLKIYHKNVIRFIIKWS